MNAVDTNVLIYRLDRHDLIKQAKARALVRRLTSDPTPTVLLWQVLGELVRQLRYWQDKGQINRQGVLRYASAVRKSFPLLMPTPNVLDHALDLSARFSLSHWDSVLLGACKEGGVTTLYTEDMGAPVNFDGIQLVNPF
ncbi:MAG: PIN domain-containing protein [Gemmataceae bacterium]|nr:PIN domain-containing protein [Gemmataceae bacterium]